MHNKNIALYAAGAFLLFAQFSAAHAQVSSQGEGLPLPAQPMPLEAPSKRSLELSAGTQNLTAGLGDWEELTLRGTYGLGQHTLQGELSQNRRFDQNGTFLGISDTFIFDEDWFGRFSVGAGDGAFYLPRYRVDASFSRKWLDRKNLVTTFGLGYYDAPDNHTDRSVSASMAYYFEGPWIVEGGVRMNNSSPGSIDSQQQFVAVTYGRDKQDLVTARYGYGGEGYLSIASDTQLVNFDSNESSIVWRHWFNSRTGFLLGANHYDNPAYTRSGITVGIFHDF
ncbi:MAG: YaiO family outer membrane beta-barrel protein [Limnobacter sp.]|nr:YaiO family outer membrane beta-barrel protein [Limnobacter sp.]